MNASCQRVAPEGFSPLAGGKFTLPPEKKTKARGSPTGRRPDSALVFYGQDLGFKVKPKSFFMLWFQLGGGYAALFPVETKGEVSPMGQSHIKKPPMGDLNGRRPRGIKQKGSNLGGAHAHFS